MTTHIFVRIDAYLNTLNLASNSSSSQEIKLFEQNLNGLDLEKRKQTIDAYSRVVLKFQNWMILLYRKLSKIKIKPEVKISEDDQAIFDFVYIYSQIFPSMFFYQIKGLKWTQGFDLISLLVTDFKYLGISFRDLPIVYQSVFDQIKISLVWYDDKLKLKLEEFYKKIIPLLHLNSDLLKLNILPVSLLENKDFENIFKNSDKIRVKTKNNKDKINNKNMINCDFEDYSKLSYSRVLFLRFKLEFVKENLKDKRESINTNEQEGKLKNKTLLIYTLSIFLFIWFKYFNDYLSNNSIQIKNIL